MPHTPRSTTDPRRPTPITSRGAVGRRGRSFERRCYGVAGHLAVAVVAEDVAGIGRLFVVMTRGSALAGVLVASSEVEVERGHHDRHGFGVAGQGCVECTLVPAECLRFAVLVPCEVVRSYSRLDRRG